MSKEDAGTVGLSLSCTVFCMVPELQSILDDLILFTLHYTLSGIIPWNSTSNVHTKHKICEKWKCYKSNGMNILQGFCVQFLDRLEEEDNMKSRLAYQSNRIKHWPKY